MLLIAKQFKRRYFKLQLREKSHNKLNVKNDIAIVRGLEYNVICK